MNKSLADKEKLLIMLTGIYDQLEELESVLEASFSEQRVRLKKEEQGKLMKPIQKIAFVENTINKINPIYNEENPDFNPNQLSKSLKLELGY
ncbi:hypothetical protein [Neobacillus vireti]|uniref:Uncharacterized protein n=1 Tax=Neobacillus vireti LMG 21834 TaxID=1131730 RepID=A0AB94ISI5_9BACI|nr:hypothetical protein [Neobacillus vireti]ETI70024.1 hypothetical protein BAVI_04309 [Neobacillus vireti LMG 21834]KLT17201.1 hypothetical protein AA980_15050 [Neobacillus vireti]